LAGVAVGGCDAELGLLAPQGRLARHWSGWTAAALTLFAANVALIVVLGPSMATIGLAPLARQLIMGTGFVLCCGAMSFAMLAVCRRLINTPTQVLDSPSRNAYGIYLVHYGFVLWLQFALLPAPLPAAIKAAVVLTVGLSASWAITAGLRRIPAVARDLVAARDAPLLALPCAAWRKIDRGSGFRGCPNRPTGRYFCRCQRRTKREKVRVFSFSWHACANGFCDVPETEFERLFANGTH